MSEALHTALPWRYEHEPSNHIRSDAGCVFAWDYTTPENAALIVTSVNERPALLRRIDELKAALRPFVEVAENDIGSDEANDDQFQPFTSNYNRAPKLLVGDSRRARAALSPVEGQASTSTTGVGRTSLRPENGSKDGGDWMLGDLAGVP